MIIHVETVPGDYMLDPHPGFSLGTQPHERHRAPGWHGKELLYYVLDEAGLLDNDIGKPFVWNWRARCGFMWEDYMSARLNTVGQPGEIAIETGLVGVTEDGRDVSLLHINPDGISEDVEWRTEGVFNAGKLTGEVCTVLEEFKYTSKSAKTNPVGKKMWAWHMQVMLYLIGMDQKFGGRHTKVRIWVLFSEGDYSHEDDKFSLCQCWWVEYTPEEIDKNFEQLKDYLRRRIV